MGKTKCAQSAAFLQRKGTFLAKADKSSAGGIDAHAQEVCAEVNKRDDAFTTSSCSGRAFLWRGEGVKSTSNFRRYRVTHELIPEAEPYFDLGSLAEDVVDAAWEAIRRTREKAPERTQPHGGCLEGLACMARSVCGASAASSSSAPALPRVGSQDPVVWLRFEPFILHVCCRDFPAAARLIAAARLVFKNVGVQSWSEGKVMVAIWGDEGLEMALTDPQGRSLFAGQAAWLQEQVNSRHRRNWAKIDRFTEALRSAASDAGDGTGILGPAEPALEGSEDSGEDSELVTANGAAARAGQRAGPRHFDIIGDVALLSAPPPEAERAAAGASLLAENRKIKVVAARSGGLQTDHRRPGALEIIAGPDRRPLMTTHSEFGVQYVVNLEAAFFNPRMGPERQRICGQVQQGERVCVLFAGCCPEALQLADKTEAESIVAVELNPDAVRCARRSLEMMERRNAVRAGCLQILEGDVLAVVPGLEQGCFHRVLAPRPKGRTEEEDGELVASFLGALLPLLRAGGVCHWYDFVADWEFPTCERSTARIAEACRCSGRECKILRCAAANNKPVAERQYRTVIDFSVH